MILKILFYLIPYYNRSLMTEYFDYHFCEMWTKIRVPFLSNCIISVAFWIYLNRVERSPRYFLDGILIIFKCIKDLNYGNLEEFESFRRLGRTIGENLLT